MAGEEATPFNAPAADETQARNGRRLLIAGCILAVLLSAGTPLYVSVYRHVKGQVALQHQVQAINRACEPLTGEEMQITYDIAPTNTDITEAWREALTPLDDAGYRFAAEQVPIVGHPTIKLDESLTPDQEAAIGQFLAQQAEKLQGLYKVAQLSGEVRFRRDFATDDRIAEYALCRDATRLLALEFQILVRSGDLAKVSKNLEARKQVGNILQDEADLTAWLTRLAIHGHTLSDIRHLAANSSLSDDKLEQLQQLTRSLDASRQLIHALIAERALFYQTRYLEAGQKKDSLPRLKPAACAEWLQRFDEMIGAARSQDFRDFRTVAGDLRVIEADNGPPPSIGISDEWNSGTIEAIAESFARGIAYPLLTDAALSARRYRLLHQRWPPTLAELVPRLLPATPIDPFDGQPLRLRLDGERLRIYSVGGDLRDDRGEKDPVIGIDFDIVVEVAPITP